MPLTSPQFDRLMQPFSGEAPRFAVALSGGPDSMALAMLLHEWVKPRGGTLHAFTVDHRLREGSTVETEQVGTWLAARNIAHHLLTWHHPGITSAIHAEARKARYDLLLQACHAQNITHLFLAHHADDQAETVLMRFARGSGPDGLAAMPLSREQDGILLCRPLLPIRKVALIETCAANNWSFVTDPSNSSPRFARARIREAQESLEREGMSVERLYELARLNGIQRAHMEAEVNAWLDAHSSADAYGVIRIGFRAWQAQSEAMRCRLLTRCLLSTGGADYAPRGNGLDRLMAKLLAEHFTDQTLSGCLIAREDDAIIFTREESAVDDMWPAKIWDRRFAFSAALPEGMQLKKLGLCSRAALEKSGFSDIAALPAKTRIVLPALYKAGELYDIPVFGDKTLRRSHINAKFLPRNALKIKVFHPCPAIVD